MRRPWAALPDRRSPDPHRLAPGETLPRRYAPMGASQSYGDAAISDDGVTPISAGRGAPLVDGSSGTLRVAAGTTIGEIVAAIGPKGWLLPAIPGSPQATIGGAVAVDAHGKDVANGSIARHVRSVLVRRSDCPEPVRLTPDDPRFLTVIGGFGAGGLIEELEVKLQRLPGPAVRLATIPFDDLSEWLAITQERRSDLSFASLSFDGSPNARSGTAFLGSWSDGPAAFAPPGAWPLPSIPLLRGRFGRGLRALRTRVAERPGERIISARDALWPMGRLAAYGPLVGGIVQHHARLPLDHGLDAIAAMFELIRRARVVAPLVVIKRFEETSPSPLGFVAPGVSIAIDLPFDRGETPPLLRALATMSVEAGGSVYLAKDSGGMSPMLAARAYPRAAEMLSHRDPSSRPSILVRLFPESYR